MGLADRCGIEVGGKRLRRFGTVDLGSTPTTVGFGQVGVARGAVIIVRDWGMGRRSALS